MREMHWFRELPLVLLLSRESASESECAPRGRGRASEYPQWRRGEERPRETSGHQLFQGESLVVDILEVPFHSLLAAASASPGHACLLALLLVEEREKESFSESPPWNSGFTLPPESAVTHSLGVSGEHEGNVTLPIENPLEGLISIIWGI